MECSRRLFKMYIMQSTAEVMDSGLGEDARGWVTMRDRSGIHRARKHFRQSGGRKRSSWG